MSRRPPLLSQPFALLAAPKQRTERIIVAWLESLVFLYFLLGMRLTKTSPIMGPRHDKPEVFSRFTVTSTGRVMNVQSEELRTELDCKKQAPVQEALPVAVQLGG